jgi:hypothetical protein
VSIVKSFGGPGTLAAIIGNSEVNSLEPIELIAAT